MEQKFFHETAGVDAEATNLYKTEPAAGIDYITGFTVRMGDQLVTDWNGFYHYLFMKFKDGNIMQSEGFKLLDNGNGKSVPKKPSQPGYGKEWERKMVEGTNDRLRVGK